MSLDARQDRFAVGPYLVDLEHRKILLRDTEVTVHWRSFEALRILIEANGNVVSKERMIEQLWSGAAVEESNLHKYVSLLRKTLSAGDEGLEYVQTIPRIGYRLSVPVNPWSEGIPSSPPASTSHSGRSRLRRLPAAGLMLAAVAAALVAGNWWWRERRPPDESERLCRAGMELIRQRTLPSVRRGAAELRRVVELHPQFARAWAGLGESCALLSTGDAVACAEFAERAVQLNADCAECQATLGFVRFARQWRWREAGDNLRRAVALKSDDPQIQYWYAQRELALGRTAHALVVIDAALKRNPEALSLYVLRAAALYFSRDFAGAVRAADHALTVNLSNAWHWRAKALFLLPNHPEAVRSLANDLGEWTSRSPESVAQRGDSYVKRYYEAGLKGVLDDLLEFTSHGDGPAIHAENRARWYMLRGKPSQALRSLETAVETRVFDVIYLGVDPLFDTIREHPDFQSLLKQIRLVQ